MTKNKVEQYTLTVKDGLPPKRTKTKYDTKMFNGALLELAERIKHGQYVEGLSVGSAGKFIKRVEARGFKALRRCPQGESRATVYVVSREWFAENPDV